MYIIYTDIQIYIYILGAFTKLRKAIISFVMSVYPTVCPPTSLSVRMEQLGSRWTDFHEILCVVFFQNPYKIQAPVTTEDNNGHFK
jgi:hypothetical protein